MSSFRRIILVVALASLLGACSWPFYRTELGQSVVGQAYRNFLIIGVAEDAATRRALEDGLAASLRAGGASASAAHGQIRTKRRGAERRLIAAAADRFGNDAVIICRLITIEKQEIYHAPRVVKVPADVRDSSCCGRPKVLMEEAGYSAKHKVLRLETRLFDAATKRQVWFGRLLIVDPESDENVIREVVAVVQGEMQEKGYVL